MSWIVYLTRMITSILLGMLSAVFCKCPANIAPPAMKCVGQMDEYTVQRNTDPSQRMVWSYERLKLACTRKTFYTVINCIEDLRYECRHNTRELERLKLYIDTSAIKRAVEELCQGVDSMKKHAECMQAQLVKVRPCLENLVESFQHRHRLAMGNETQIIQSYCSLMKQAYSCQSTATRRACGPEPAFFQKRIMEAFLPPACSPVSRSVATSLTDRPSHRLINTLQLVAYLLCVNCMIIHLGSNFYR